jgi:DNA-directed RNA polymerase II subunit RPB2
MKPDPTKVTGMRHGSYDKLNESGYVPEETEIVNGDIILAKVSPIPQIGESNKIYKDSSEVYRSNAPGVVDKVITGIYNNEGYEIRKMRIRSERIPRIGDKFCSRHGQKGTIGIAKKHSNMPFTKYGLVPDIIVNPNAIPSRMTIGQLVECVVGKSAAIEGLEADGTPFNGIDTDAAEEKLGKLGYNKKGYEYMYNGETSLKMKTMIFIGPTHYQRLKHIVEDKIHSRSRGPRTLITRQPPEGRSRDGGLRLGEMERD